MPGVLFHRGTSKLIVYNAPVMNMQIKAPWDITQQEKASLVCIESSKPARSTPWYPVWEESYSMPFSYKPGEKIIMKEVLQSVYLWWNVLT